MRPKQFDFFNPESYVYLATYENARFLSEQTIMTLAQIAGRRKALRRRTAAFVERINQLQQKIDAYKKDYDVV